MLFEADTHTTEDSEVHDVSKVLAYCRAFVPCVTFFPSLVFVALSYYISAACHTERRLARDP